MTVGHNGGETSGEQGVNIGGGEKRETGVSGRVGGGEKRVGGSSRDPGPCPSPCPISSPGTDPCPCRGPSGDGVQGGTRGKMKDGCG